MESKVIVGLDLGQKGGLVITQDGKILEMLVMPLVSDNDVNIRSIAKALKKYDTKNMHVVFEKFGGFFGYQKSASVSLARQGGMIEATLILLGIPFTKVQPQMWQKVVWEGTNILHKSDGKKDTKKISLVTANRLFPHETFMPSKAYKKPHDGLVDAALLAEYGRRKNL